MTASVSPGRYEPLSGVIRSFKAIVPTGHCSCASSSGWVNAVSEQAFQTSPCNVKQLRVLFLRI